MRHLLCMFVPNHWKWAFNEDGTTRWKVCRICGRDLSSDRVTRIPLIPV